MRIILLGAAAVALVFSANIGDAKGGKVAENAIKRGQYLTGLGGCGDCHSPGYFLGKLDETKHLAGSDVGFQTPGGTFVGPNLTSDKETGLGNWSKEEIVKALQEGTRPDGRVLADVMPWKDFARLTTSDAEAIATYLMSLKPIKNQVPAPLQAGEKPKFPVLTVVFPDGEAVPAQ